MTLQDARALLAALRPPESRPGRVELQMDGPVAHLRLDNPGSRSAMTLAMMVQLADAVEALGAFSGGVVVVSSTDPRAFCSGGHLADVTRAIDSPARAEQMFESMSCVLGTLSALPVISVAALDGLALGGGAELAAACDWRVVGPSGSMHFVHARLGIAPGWGGTERLTALLGRRSALEVLARAASIGPQEGVALGLFDAVCTGEAVAGALAWLAPILAHPPAALRAVKAQIVAATAGDRAAAAAAFAGVWGAADHQAALDRLARHRDR